jgi:hypothetical protein
VTCDAIDRQQMLRDALGHLQSALDQLDRASAPAHIGAHIDLAIHELVSGVAANDVATPQRAERR